MPKEIRGRLLTEASLALLLLSFPIVAFAQKQVTSAVETTAKKDVKGVDIIVVKKPQGTAKTARVKGDGSFDFGILPAGTYSVTLKVADDQASNSGKTYSTAKSNTATVSIAFDGTATGKVMAGWDLKARKPLRLTDNRARDSGAGAEAMSMPPAPEITFEADGKQVVKGTMQFIEN